MRTVPTALLVACLAIAVWLSPLLFAAVVVLAVGLYFGTEGAALMAFRNFVALGSGLSEELQCSAELEVSYSVGHALNTDVGHQCHDHLTATGTVTDTFEDWRLGVIASATQTIGSNADRETVTFQVKGTHLWKNGEPVWEEAIYHERLIPHESFADVRSGSSYDPNTDGLRIRILVRSGFLVLQLGGWQRLRADSQPGLEQPSKDWETICCFPVLFSVLDHFIAERFLLATYAVPPGGSVPTERDKKQLARDLRNYRYVCNAPRSDARYRQIVENFEGRKKAWLKKYGFKTPDATTYACSLVSVKFVDRRLGNWVKRFGDEHRR